MSNSLRTKRDQFSKIANFSREFDVTELLGEGSFGAVYKAIHKSSNTIVAAKAIKIKKSNQLEKLAREISILRSCESPYIVEYYGSCIQAKKQDKFLWILMEYCALGCAKDIMNILGTPLEELQISAICKSVLLGLDYLHSSTMQKVHRDIKSENILINDKGDIKLADFGVSGSLGAYSDKMKTVIGTPYFLAPEVITQNEGGYTSKVDLWSLGITTIEMGELVPPYWEEETMSVLLQIPMRPSPTFSHPTKWSEEIKDFVAKCLLKDFNLRPTAKELLQHPFITMNESKHVEAMKTLIANVTTCIKQQGGIYNATHTSSPLNERLASIRKRKSTSKLQPVVNMTLEAKDLYNKINETFEEKNGTLRVKKRSQTSEVKDWHWINDPEQGDIPAYVLSRNPPNAILKDQSGKQHTVPLDKLVSVSPLTLVGVDNMVTLQELSAPSLYYTLYARFQRGSIYTYIDSILIAVNPWQDLPIYTKEQMSQYRKFPLEKILRDKPPHIYGTTELAYQALRREQMNQALIIGGESGSGKTETSKHILKYLAEISSENNSLHHQEASAIVQQIVETSVILEAFGNANTVQNPNSSRFGKLILVYFDQKGSISGGDLIHYLLETSRVVQQAESDQNYHCFYYLLYGAPDSLKKSLLLDSNTNYSFLNVKSKASQETQFSRIQNALSVIGLSNAQCEAIYRVLSIILHLGNIQFKPVKEDSCAISNPEFLSSVSSLLGIDPDRLEKALLERSLITSRTSSYSIALTTNQASDSRNALAKSMYSLLFQWIVKKINEILNKSRTVNENFVAILDIFGFEVFQKNSFEQLCINYANEHLQQMFNKYVFLMEQEEYKREDLFISEFVTYTDNNQALNLIEGKPMGLMSLLDEQCKLPKGSDLSYVDKILSTKHPALAIKKKRVPTEFSINHYAGEVTYDVTGFLDKNRDTLNGDLVLLMSQSKEPFVRDLFVQKKKDDDLATKKRLDTVSLKFKESLNGLLSILSTASPFFVRCIKPNSQQDPKIFDAGKVTHQIKVLGLMETVKMRQYGFPIRKSFLQFYQRYIMLSVTDPHKYKFVNKEMPSKEEQAKYSCVKLTAMLLNMDLLSSNTFQLGKTKIFLKENQYLTLESARDKKMGDIARTIQTTWRQYQFTKKRRATIVLQTALRSILAKKAFQAEKLKHARITSVPARPKGLTATGVPTRPQSTGNLPRAMGSFKGAKVPAAPPSSRVPTAEIAVIATEPKTPSEESASVTVEAPVPKIPTIGPKIQEILTDTLIVEPSEKDDKPPPKLYPWSSQSPGKGTKAIAEEFGDLLSDLRTFSDARVTPPPNTPVQRVATPQPAKKPEPEVVPDKASPAPITKLRSQAMTKQTRHTYGSPSPQPQTPSVPEPPEARKWTQSNRFHYVSGSYVKNQEEPKAQPLPPNLTAIKSEYHRNTTGSQPNFKKL